MIAFDRYNPNNQWGWLEESAYKKDMEVILGDVRDYDSVSKAMQDCHAVLHLAALIGIPYSYISPLAYIRTNIEGTYNVLEAAKNLNIEQVLITSTSETYGTAQYVPIDEKHPLVGQSPYAASKIAADQLALSYYLSFGLPIKIVRPFNTYGPRQSLRAIIPTIITQGLNGNGKIKLGNIACHLSHKKAVKTFLRSGAKNCIIFEDDILIENNEELIQKVNKFIKYDFDVLYLGCWNYVKPISIEPYLSKVVSACCNHAYIVKSHYYDTIIKNLSDGIELKLKYLPTPQLFQIQVFLL